MDKVNEAIEVSEQETPFHLLPQEEQQHIIDANRKRVREAQTLHEWDIRVSTAFAWPMILIVVGSMMLFGGAAVWFAGDNDWTFVYMMVGMSIVMTLYLRYLVMADKNYHYRMTTEGLIVTYHDAIPEVAYTIVRGLAWFGVVVCVMAVAVLGPLALVGAGGMALFAVFFTDFKSEVCEEFTLFNKKWPHVFTISKRHRALRFESVPFKSAFSRTLYCRVEDIDVILNLIKSHILVESVKYIKGHPGI
ncbi:MULTISPECIES: hypothetical protein [Aeromonas]|uniref:hypothetical protein n=1 Tax=Aeromonas TaxID=642 RepID=UPI000DA2F674|nr:MULTISPECIES: hypothetical protein [Aeromonas]MBS4636874.1 hypothetical protein [Aeromonas caviae]MDH0306330.1 hypothetical protein [Aeromonas caviae]MDU7582913.1 hypothetical protein [Aeromonas sp.]MDX7682599.1 hypothetical protein [Aeromonas caviae]MDX7726026.1 hypothetical protein [Aeromonas caviae]